MTANQAMVYLRASRIFFALGYYTYPMPNLVMFLAQGAGPHIDGALPRSITHVNIQISLYILFEILLK